MGDRPAGQSPRYLQVGMYEVPGSVIPRLGEGEFLETPDSRDIDWVRPRGFRVGSGRVAAGSVSGGGCGSGPHGFDGLPFRPYRWRDPARGYSRYAPPVVDPDPNHPVKPTPDAASPSRFPETGE